MWPTVPLRTWRPTGSPNLSSIRAATSSGPMRPPPQSVPNPWWEREKRWRAAQREATSERPPRFAVETSGYGVRVRAMPRRIEMPRFWSHKRERQFEHIRNGLEERGESKNLAEEIAARTVNKERARNGEAKSSSYTSNSRHFIRQERRASIASGTGWPDQAAAVRRSPPQGSQRTIDNEQGAARARRDWALRAAPQVCASTPAVLSASASIFVRGSPH